MKRAFFGALLGAALATHGVAQAQPADGPSAQDKARVKGKMKDFGKELRKVERQILTEDMKAEKRAKAEDEKAAAAAKKAEKRDAKPMAERGKAELKKAMAASKENAAEKKGPMTAEEREERRTNILARAKARKSNRKERASELRARGRATLMAVPGSAQAKVAQEMKHHARRIARLERIAVLAAEAKDEAAEDRVAMLTEKEIARHQAKMKRLTEGAEEGGE